MLSCKTGNNNNEIYIDRLGKYNILLLEMCHEENNCGQPASSKSDYCKMPDNL